MANDRLDRGWWLKHPGWFVQVAGTSFVGWLFGTKARHILVETDGVVVDRGWTTTSIFKAEGLIDRYPGVIGCIVYSCPGGSPTPVRVPTIERHASTPKALLCNLLRLCTFGRVKILGYGNCVDMAVSLLEHEGCYLPTTAWHPRDLLVKLLEAQLEWQPRISAGSASNGRGTDQST